MENIMSNVIIVTTDQQRFDTLGCNGNAFIRTPNLDRLAKQGARFERAYCTNPVCTPSRVSIMTGQLPSRHGSYNIGTIAADTENFLSTVLTGRGYRTHQIGKAHFYPWDTASPETEKAENANIPFYNFAGFETAELSVGHSSWGVSGHYEAWLLEKGIKKGCRMPQLQTKWLFPEGKDAYQTGDWGMPKKYHSGAWILERTERFLQERNTEQPFYLNLGFQDPHHPLVLPRDQERISEDRIPLPEGEFDPRVKQLTALYEGRIEETYGGRFGIAGNQDTVWRDTDRAVKQKVRSYYYSMAELFDSQMGELFRLLEKYQVLEDTLLVITSDHGDMLFDHGLGEKGPMAFEEVLSVPLLIHFPKQIKPCVVTEPVSLADLYPTVLDYAGIATETVCDGISLRTVIDGGACGRKGVIAEFKEEKDAIRWRCFITGEWKLVEYPGEAFGELYNLKEDPGEAKNLWFDAIYLPVKYELLRQMLFERERHDFLARRPCRC